MSGLKVLLGLDGSAECMYAAEFACKLARRSAGSADAVHVVDTPLLRDFLICDHQGFIGSGPYMTARDEMKRSLDQIGGILLEAFEAHTTARRVLGESFHVEGNPVREITRLADNYDIIVLGHKQSVLASRDQDRRKFRRPSLAGLISTYSPCPVLVVQEMFATLERVVITICGHWLEETSLGVIRSFGESLASFAALCGLSGRFCCWTEERKYKKAEQVLLETFPDISESLETSLELVRPNETLVWEQLESTISAGELPVLPVVSTNNHAITAFGVNADELLKYCSLPAILFWPVSYRLEHTAEDIDWRRRVASPAVPCATPKSIRESTSPL